VDQSADPSEPTVFWRFCRGIARLLATLMFEMRVYGLENVPRRGGVLLISNHQSYLDPVLLATFVRRQISFLAKSELFENKYFGWLIRSLHAFPIRQGAGDVGAMKETIRRLREGHGLTLFAEGHRTETGELLPIQPGAALVIRRAGVPVVPCVIQGSYRGLAAQAEASAAAPNRDSVRPAAEGGRIEGRRDHAADRAHASRDGRRASSHGQENL
jgi:1-acyl-sn-glycerol-3-phosphate acyltransferase